MKAPNPQEQRADASYIPVRGRKERKAIPPETISGILNESPSPRHRVKGKRTKCKHSKLKVRSSMKVVLALNAPDVRHEITLLGGVWEPPAQGKRRNQPQGTPKEVCQKGLGVLCTRGKGGTQAWNPLQGPFTFLTVWTVS